MNRSIFNLLKNKVQLTANICMLTTLICVFQLNGQAQENDVNYFTEKSYPEHPVISFRENLLGVPIYFIEGQKTRASEVRAYMEIIPGDARDFNSTHTKVMTGTGLILGGFSVSAGALVYYLGMNVNNQVVRNWFFINLAGGVIGSIGQNMSHNGKRQINNYIDNYNYLIRQEEIDKPYLQMDNRLNLLGEKIDIYHGRDLLDKRQLSIMMSDYPDLFDYMEKAHRRQRLSSALDILGLVSSLVTVAYIISPQFQSSTPSQFMVPLIGFNIGLGVSSSIVRRSARNTTREALHRFNFAQ